MATTTTDTPLRTNSASLDEPEKQHILPKSYSEVLEEDLPPYEQIGSGQTNGTNDTMNEDRTDHAAPVLRIVDTGASAEGTGEAIEEDGQRSERNRPSDEDAIDSLDERQKPKNVTREDLETDRKPNGTKKSQTDSLKTKHGDVVAPALAKYKGYSNGIDLTSIKPSSDFEEELQLGVREAKKLVSGRKAGQGWERSGIRFAPLNLPLRRRLQTMMVLFHTLCIAIAVSSFFFMCAIPLFWPLMIPYMMYCMLSDASTSGTLSTRSEFLRSLRVWSLFASYFPARLHRSEELSPTRKYIFGYHPHGIISHGAFAAFGTEALGFKQLFPGITNTLLTLDSNFRIPFYRDYALALGLASVSKESCENILSKGGPNNEGMGRAITIVVGGARESLDAQPYRTRLVLKRRKGFVKMAIRTGADLVPVLGFGENDLYDQFQADSHPRIHKIQLLAKKILGFTIPLFHARGVFNYDVGLMPYRRPLNVVVGKPIEVVQADRPEQEYIDQVHEQYVSELERMWELWKDEFASERKEELQILE